METKRIPKVYCETSFWSYLTGGTPKDEKTARWQWLTRRWWEEVAPLCKIFVSEYVVEEALKGNADMAQLRLRHIAAQNFIDAKIEQIIALTESLKAGFAIPQGESTDALHVATSALHGMDVLLTWNCKHLANPATLPRTVSIVLKAGCVCPAIITPEDFFAHMEDFGL